MRFACSAPALMSSAGFGWDVLVFQERLWRWRSALRVVSPALRFRAHVLLVARSAFLWVGGIVRVYNSTGACCAVLVGG